MQERQTSSAHPGVLVPLLLCARVAALAARVLGCCARLRVADGLAGWQLRGPALVDAVQAARPGQAGGQLRRARAASLREPRGMLV